MAKNGGKVAFSLTQKKQIYSRPENMSILEAQVNSLLQITCFEDSVTLRIMVRWTFEFLCFIINTPDGERLYLKLLNHISKFCPNIAEIYWDVFESKDNMIEHYMQETPEADRLINQYLLAKLN